MLTLCRVLLYIAIGLLIEAISNPKNDSMPNIFIIMIWPVLIILVAYDLIKSLFKGIEDKAVEKAKAAQKESSIIEEDDDLDELDI